jgi:hypothetical protein
MIQGLALGVVKQGLPHAGGFELPRQEGIQFLARECVQVVLHASGNVSVHFLCSDLG